MKALKQGVLALVIFALCLVPVAQSQQTMGLTTVAWQGLRTLFTAGVLTTGGINVTQAAAPRTYTSSYSWTNAQVVACGAALTCDLAVATLPAGTVVNNVYVRITGAATGPTTLTGAVGRVSAAYIDYIVASDFKAAANTVYGDASAERGTNLVGYDLPSITGTTVINLHLIATVANLDQTLASSGTIYIVTTTLL